MMADEQRIKELVIRSADGDSGAFAELYELCYKDLYKTALYTLGNVHDAENAVSETVLDAFAGIKKLRDPSAFRAWIFAILSNKCKAILRSYVKSREHLSQKSPDDLQEVLGDEDPNLKRAEEETVLQKAFSVLSEEEKLIVNLTIYGRLDSGQVGERLKINPSTVRSKYRRSLRKMKEVLALQ